MNTTAAPRSIDIVGHEVTLQWDDRETTLTATRLRQGCRCTDCRRMAMQGATYVAPADLRVTGATPVGRYGVQLHFSDGHERGIYPWRYLHELRELDDADLKVT